MEVGGVVELPGSPGGGAGSGAARGGGAPPTAPGEQSAPRESTQPIQLTPCEQNFFYNVETRPAPCGERATPAEEAEDEEVPAIPPISAADIASFLPVPPAVTTEPAGIAAVGMPMNTVTGSSAHTVEGQLFGLPVSVRFTPAGFRHDFGDGTVRTVDTGGASWATLGQPEFTPTPTSHTYRARGEYTVTVTALYTAVVDFGEWGTYPVLGEVASTAPGQPVRVVEVHTALVSRTCMEQPAGPGC
ncbi:PKD domain-containing protein [Microbacterium album]|uniref:PKD domain-containing protein n=1 Tax=Microbacterium album TaxID=2053191 RepID=UPI001664E3A7|nr:hypothetical protein [Microbacterium album]